MDNCVDNHYSIIAQSYQLAKNHYRIINNYNWLGQGVCDDLNSIDIFDTAFGKIFSSNEAEVSYEPPVLSFFSSLITICEKVASLLDIKSSQLQSKKPNIPADKKTTVAGIWYDSISYKTSIQDIDSHCIFSASEEAELEVFQQRLTEQAPAEKAKHLRRQKAHIESLITTITSNASHLSNINILQVIYKKQQSLLKKNAADIAAESVFSDGKLDGIGSDIWKELWEASRKYSMFIAYKDTEYPNTSDGARCVLCHQTLTQEAKERLISFESFVKGEMQKAAINAADEYKKAIQSIEAIPTLTADTIKARIDAAGISDENLTKEIVDFCELLNTHKSLFLSIESEASVPQPIVLPKWVEEIKNISKEKDVLAEKYDSDAKNDNRENIKQKIYSLQAKKWLSEHRAAIIEEAERLHTLNKIQEARKSANTKSLSQKKGELAEVLITDAFVQRFNTELTALNASQIKVELVKSKVSKGRVLHKIQLRNASQSGITDVLSEGEHRIVSIASFLADVTGKNSKFPFIFDDPISSLDQGYEEAVVQRLLDLSHDRQIIIFTHRLSLLGTVKHFSEKRKTHLDVVSIRATDWGTGEPAPIPLSQSDIKSALNTLIDQRYQAAKNANSIGDFETAEILLKSICSDFRTLVERSIENDLLCGVVQRFQRPVHTLRIKDLAKLRGVDCILLDSLMTKYSGFEHSQPIESPIELPKPEDLLSDMNSLKKWREEYNTRKPYN